MILWHLSFQAPLPAARMGLLRPFVLNGWAGVDLFFALSGFLITRLILVEEAANRAATGRPRFSLKAFYVRRALRILPPFLFVFLANFLVFGPLRLSSVLLAHPPGPPRALDTFAYATFWGNYFRAFLQEADPGQAFTVFWSLCVEEHFYLLWPPLLALVVGGRARLKLAASICAAMALLRGLVTALHLDTPENVHFLSHYRMDSILWGAAGAFALESLSSRPRVRGAALGVCGAALAVVLLTRPPGGGGALHASLGFTLLAVTAALLVVEVACRPDSPPVRLLEAAPLRAVGRVSYGMYLLHFQVMELGWALVYWFEPGSSVAAYLAAFAILSAAVYGVAALMYRYVEKPFLILKDARFAAARFAPAPERVTAPAASDLTTSPR